jgi:predicted MFS family arabinose efflux permease
MSELSTEGKYALNRTVFLLSCAAFASTVALRLCDPMLPALARGFATTTGHAAVAVTGIAIAYGVCQVMFGPLGDRFGKFRVIAWACLVSTLGALACAVSPSLDWLAAARVVNGATTAALIPLSMAWIGDVVPFQDRQPTLAKFMSGQILGLVSGQALGGLFADTVGWRWGFVFLGALYLMVGVLLVRSLQTVASRDDAVSRDTSGDGGFVMSLRKILYDQNVLRILAIVFVESMTTFGALTFIPAYLHQRFDISLFLSGAIVACFGLGGLSYTLFVRRWVSALGEAGLASTGGLLLGGAFMILLLGDRSIWGVVACATAGLGFYQMHNTLQTRATQMAPQARGTAMSLFAACFFIGQATGVALGAAVVDHFGAQWLFAAAAVALPVLGWSFRRLLQSKKNPAQGRV